MMLDASPTTSKPFAHGSYSSPLGQVGLGVVLLSCYLVAALAVLGHPPPPGLVPGLFVLLGSVVILGVFWPRAGVFARPLLSGPADLPRVALTFDDGPDPEATPAILDLLERYQARATFFVIGERAARCPHLLLDMVRRGHQIENHTHRHAWTTPFLSVARLTAELEVAQEAIVAGCGRRPRWLRPPVGLISPPIVVAAGRAGLLLCCWSCKARDGVAGTTVDAALRRLSAGLRPGAILVLHDAAEDGRRPIAADVLVRLLPLLRERGLLPVTLDCLLDEDRILWVRPVDEHDLP